MELQWECSIGVKNSYPLSDAEGTVDPLVWLTDLRCYSLGNVVMKTMAVEKGDMLMTSKICFKTICILFKCLQHI